MPTGRYPRHALKGRVLYGNAFITPVAQYFASLHWPRLSRNERKFAAEMACVHVAELEARITTWRSSSIYKEDTDEEVERDWRRMIIQAIANYVNKTRECMT